MVLGARPLGAREHAAHYHARRRTRSHRDITRGLSRTHDLGIGPANYVTEAIFPVRTRPITFVTAIEITGANADGIFMTFGDSTGKIRCSIKNRKLMVVARNAISGTASHSTPTVSAFGDVGAQIGIALAINPGAATIRGWVNGDLMLRLTISSGFHDGEWCGPGDGAITDTMTDFALVEPVSAFLGQLPRQFH